MTQDKSKPITNYLQSDKDLQFVFTKLKHLQKINEKLAAHLDPKIAALCQAVNMQEGKLVMFAANSSIATHIRLHTADLLAKLRTDTFFKGLKDIQCKVYPNLAATQSITQNTTKKQHMQPLSYDVAVMISEMANSLSDTKLQEIMHRIAGRIKK